MRLGIPLLPLLLLALAGPGAAEEVWLEVDGPEPAVAGWLELSGRGGVGSGRAHDVVVALDLSSSTWLASGVDVDGDGHVGRVSGRVQQLRRRSIQTTRIERIHYSSDPDDTTAAALVAAARVLVGELDARRSRVALVDFAESAQVAAPLGSSREALEQALDAIAERSTTRGGDTSFAAAIEAGLELMRSPEEPEAGARTRSLLLLSDGYPTHPAPPSAARAAALEAAWNAQQAGVRIFAFALGPEARRALPVFQRLASLTGGETRSSQVPGDALALLPRARLSGIERVTLENRTTGAQGSAVRLFADGRFDGWVPVVAGENQILVRAETADGQAAEVVRRVVFTEAEAETAEEREAGERAREALMERLRARTVETELQLEMDRRRRALQRELELEAERPDQKP